MDESIKSLTGRTRDELFAEREPPAWLLQAEGVYGPMVRHSALYLPGQRTVHLTRFAQAWRLCLVNPENPPDVLELDCFLTDEALEAILLLQAMLRDGPVDTEHPFPALEGMMETLKIQANVGREED